MNKIIKENEEKEVVICTINGKKITTKTRVSTLEKLLEDVKKELNNNDFTFKKTERETREKLVELLENLIKEKKVGKKKTIKDISITISPEEMDKAINNIKLNSKDRESVDDEDASSVNFSAETIVGLSKEIRRSIITMDRKDARYMVDTYYQIQKLRIGLENQVRSVNQEKDGEGNVSIMEYASISLRLLEESVLDGFRELSKSSPVTLWMNDIIGIGPIMSSMLYAYLNVEGVNHAGNFWSYAGLNDNNNPWLGKEKANSIVNEIYNIREIKCKAFVKATKGIIDKKDLDEAVQYAKECNYDEVMLKQYLLGKFYRDTIIDICDKAYQLSSDSLFNFKQVDELDGIENTPEAMELLTDEEREELAESEDSKLLGTINTKGPFDDDDFIDFIIYLTDSNIASFKIIMMVVQKLNGRRKYGSICKSAVERKEDNKYYDLISKDSLKKYLSKPPYNIKLKVLMWKVGKSFVMVSNNKNSLYGRIYRERKAYEIEKNERGDYKIQALRELKKKKYGKNTEAYKSLSQGKLPLAQIEARAKRFAVKVFINHLFEMMYICLHHKMPEMPYPISVMGHVDYIGPEVPYTKYTYVTE